MIITAKCFMKSLDFIKLINFNGMLTHLRSFYAKCSYKGHSIKRDFFEQRSVIKLLVDEKCKLWEI